jgi:hypothetical protein
VRNRHSTTIPPTVLCVESIPPDLMAPEYTQ